MSGGFFRGTSADQDTRFSNKQAKLLKTQKFPSELDHPVDMTKVKLDVVRPWIANRVTELLGFEDEVLINFVYGLLDGKEVDGKQVQIQLTGFMEKNTGKFMKELWSLLLSAQSNASGVPQQFLDAKEEETKKKKAENDRIAYEILKRRERDSRDLSRDESRMGAEANTARSNEAANDLVTNHPSPRTSDEKIEEERKGSPRFNIRSPTSAGRSRSKSKSRSYSRESPRSRSRSVSSESSQHSPRYRRRHHSPAIRSSPVRSVSPRSKRLSPHIPSPPRRRSPFGRRRSTSHPRRRSPSPRRRSPPARQRSPSYSPVRRRLPSPVYRRSRTPVRHRMRSPLCRRSPSPPCRRSPPPRRRRSRSPLRRRSPSPKLRRSPFQIRRSRSPLRLRRPPVGRTSISPTRHSSSSPPRRSPEGRSPALLKRSTSPSRKRRLADSRISTRQRNRSRTPGSRSPFYRARRSLSRDLEEHIRGNGFQTKKHRDELFSERGRRISPDKEAGRRDAITSHSSRYKVSDSFGSPRAPPGDNNSVPSTDQRERDSALKRRSPSSLTRPFEQSRKLVSRHDSPEATKEDNRGCHEREGGRHSTRDAQKRSKYSPTLEPKRRPDPREKGPSASATNKPSGSLSPVGRSHAFDQQKGPRSELYLLENGQRQSPSDDEYYARGRFKGKMVSIDNGRARCQSKKQESEVAALGGDQFKKQSMQESSHRDSLYAKDGMRCRLEEEKEDKDSFLKRQSGGKSSKNGIQRNDLDIIGSDFENSDDYSKKDKRKRKKSSRHKKYSDSDSSYSDAEEDCRGDDKKVARRRKKEERKKRKEEKRQRKEERHRRRLEGRGDKLKGRSMDTVTPPLDLEKNYKNNDEEAHDFAKQGKQGSSHPNDMEMESEQKMLEIELRKKALDSLRAKKAINS